jgi:Ca2+-binding RTX toxin-like protein
VSTGLLITGNAGTNALTGTSFADQLFGGPGTDTLAAGAGDDLLNGGLGLDTLTGGPGRDTFVFDTLPNTNTNRDTITDFLASDDTLQFENAVYTGLSATGVLAAGQLRVGAGLMTAGDADDRFIYNPASGILYYDANGSAAGAAPVRVAVFSNLPTLTAADFFIT